MPLFPSLTLAFSSSHIPCNTWALDTLSPPKADTSATSTYSMKGSPVITTIISCIIMLGMYLCMHFMMGKPAPTEPTEVKEPLVRRDSQVAYADIAFSSPPKQFTITNPLTDEVILKLDDVTDLEWSGDLNIPKDTESLELRVDATWEKHSGHQFIYIVLSTDEQDATSTLKSTTNIQDTATFHWR